MTGGILLCIFGIVYQMKTQRVIIHNNRNEKLVGYLYQGTAKTLIIVCYGIESPKDSSLRKLLAPYFSEIVKRSGASVYSFDFSGMGESEGKEFISLRQRDKEVKIVIDYFLSKSITVLESRKS